MSEQLTTTAQLLRNDLTMRDIEGLALITSQYQTHFEWHDFHLEYGEAQGISLYEIFAPATVWHMQREAQRFLAIPCTP